MKAQILSTNSFSSLSSNTRIQFKTSLYRRKPSLYRRKPSLYYTFFNRTKFLNLEPLHVIGSSATKVAAGVRFDALDIDEIAESEDGDLLVETCITRTLPPALTFECGLESIKEAVDKLKLDPPKCTSGVLRFQVAVPPSARALNWFCCQPESSGIFPVFFVSKEIANPTCKSLYYNQMHGVFGIGASIYFTHSSSYVAGDGSSKKRYLSDDSIMVTAYGFANMNFDSDSPSLKHESGSFYFFVPQIELNEHGDISTLAVTLAWSDLFHRTFEQAVQSYQSTLYQVTKFWPISGSFNAGCIGAALRKLRLIEDTTIQMVRTNAVLIGRISLGSNFVELVSPFS